MRVNQTSSRKRCVSGYAVVVFLMIHDFSSEYNLNKIFCCDINVGHQANLYILLAKSVNNYFSVNQLIE